MLFSYSSVRIYYCLLIQAWARLNRTFRFIKLYYIHATWEILMLIKCTAITILRALQTCHCHTACFIAAI